MKNAIKSSLPVIKFTCNLVEKAKKPMDPSRPYASFSALYMPLRAMTPDTSNYFGQQEVFESTNVRSVYAV